MGVLVGLEGGLVHLRRFLPIYAPRRRWDFAAASYAPHGSRSKPACCILKSGWQIQTSKLRNHLEV